MEKPSGEETDDDTIFGGCPLALSGDRRGGAVAWKIRRQGARAGCTLGVCADAVCRHRKADRRRAHGRLAYDGAAAFFFHLLPDGGLFGVCKKFSAPCGAKPLVCQRGSDDGRTLCRSRRGAWRTRARIYFAHPRSRVFLSHGRGVPDVCAPVFGGIVFGPVRCAHLCAVCRRLVRSRHSGSLLFSHQFHGDPRLLHPLAGTAPPCRRHSALSHRLLFAARLIGVRIFVCL